MSVPNLANTWKVIIKYHSGTCHFENVFHTTADDGESEQNVADDFGGAWMASGSIADMQSSIVVGDQIDVQHYDGVSAIVNCTVSGFTGASMSGSSDPVPVQVAGLTTWRSGLSGRSNRGRTYFGGVSDVYLETQRTRWATGNMATLQGFIDQYLTELNAATVVTGLDVYSAKHNTKAPVIAGVFRQYFGTQRRRAEQAE